MGRFRDSLLYGFALFSMFFGSGNLVFPLQIGMNSGNQWLMGFIGLLLTGIVLPFLGLFVIKIHKGSYEDFFGQAGSVARVILPLFTLSLLGAFGVIPRCITVAHGGIASLFPSVSLIYFSVLFCIICFIMCLKDRHMVAILGKWLTPVMLVCLILLILGGIYYAPALSTQASESWSVFSAGFQRGYKTMDLFAAFFFSSFMFKQIQDKMGSSACEKSIIQAALAPSLIGAGLLGLIYFGLVFLGAYYAPIAQNVSPELILPTIASNILGEHAALVIGIIVIFACLSTAVALNNIYARYLCKLLKLAPAYFPWVLMGTTLISFTISLLDFKGIAQFLEPVLDVSYPGIILLTFLSIFMKGFRNIKTTAFYGMLLMMLGYSYL